MDTTTLGAALALAKSIPGTAVSEAQAVLEEAQTVAESIPEEYTELSGDVAELKSEMEQAEGDIDALEAGKQDTLTFDDVPTANSANPVKSGGVYAELAGKINKPIAYPDGVSGQLLRTNGDGTTEWVNQGAPTDAQVGEAVSDWLEDHPEATTTVDFTIATKVYPTVADMLADDTLDVGYNVATRAYYAAGDNGGNNYVISDTHTGVFYLTLENGLYANLLTERGTLRAESIGIKAYASTTEDPDSDDMSRNVSLFNAAIQGGIILVFGRGHFYFSSEIDLTPNTYEIYGISDNLTYLHFPSSAGFCFSNATYHQNYVIENLAIYSNGHCIYVSEVCYTVRECRFQNLTLVSATGDGVHGPNYNHNDNGSGYYDTVVQDPIFRHINVTATAGAGFANLFGHGGYYEHINFVQCKYGFQNCDGHVKQTNNLGDQQMEYFVYYDKCNTYGLRWVWDRVNAEALSKGLISCTGRTMPGQGENPSKPSSANFFTLQQFVVIDSHWDLRNITAGTHTEYPIKVQNINNIQLIGCPNFIASSQYPSLYDTTAVKGHLWNLVGRDLYTYSGGYTFTLIQGSGQTVTTQQGVEKTTQMVNSKVPYSGYTTAYMTEYDMMYVHKMFGGKALDMYKVKTSEAQLINDSLVISSDHTFFDVLVLVVDSTTNYSMPSFAANNGRLNYPGRIVTLVNDPTSQANVIFFGTVAAGYKPYGLAMAGQISILPGQCVHFILTYHTNGNTNQKYLAWRPIFTDTYGP